MDTTEKLKKILIVDDQPEITDVIEELIQLNYEVEIDTAINVISALELVSKNIYNVICTDQNMPGLNGTDFLREVRLSEGPNQSCPVVFITANPDDVKRELEAETKNVVVLNKVDEIAKVLDILTEYLN